MCALASKEYKEPSKFGIYIGRMMAGLGAFLGFLYLASLPAKSFSSVQAYEKAVGEQDSAAGLKPGEVYYLEGVTLRSRSWETVRKQFLEGSGDTVRLSSAELNAWFRSRFQPGQVPTGEDQPSIVMIPGSPNIFLEGAEHVYLSLPVELIFYGTELDWVFFAKGHFAPTDGGARFVIERMHANSAPLPGLAALSNSLVDFLLTAYSETDEFKAIREAWSGVKSVEVSGNSILLHR